jgi:2-iminobutanoate/2-iminopropanoate deaminase
MEKEKAIKNIKQVIKDLEDLADDYDTYPGLVDDLNKMKIKLQQCPRYLLSDKENTITRRQTLHAPQVMCEAYDYPKPSAFSRGVSVDIGTAHLIFVSGTASVGPKGQTLHTGDFHTQVVQTFENARAVLNNSNADWKNVIKTTIYLKNISKFYEPFNKIRCSYFQKIGLKGYPASTCVEAKLCRKDLLVEIELIAIV